MKNIATPLFAFVALSVILFAGLFAGKLSASAASAPAAVESPALLAVLPDPALTLAATSVFGVFALAYAIVNGRVTRCVRYLLHYLTVAVGLACIAVAQFFRQFFRAEIMPICAMAQTNIAALWTPQIWIPGLRERVVQAPSIINSGAVVRSPIFEEVATGGGVSGNIPFLKEPNNDDEIQVEDTAPTMNGIASGLQACPIMNRVSALGATALSRAITAQPGASAALTDPVTMVLSAVADLRLRQRQKCLLALVRGAFGSQANNADTPALKSLRTENFTEDGVNAVSTQLIDTNMMLDALATLGEVKEKMVGGALVMHSKIEAALSKQDQIDYVKNSSGEIVLRMWKGCPIYLSDLLVRAGTTSGFVYDTYFFMPGAIAMGDKPQVAQVGEAASLMMDLTQVAKNNIALYDRTRFVLHVNGMKWTGTPAGQSATNAELQTAGNWALAFGDYKNVGIAQLQTNG